MQKPRHIFDKLDYVGGIKYKGPREPDKLGPSWREFAVGHEMTLGPAAVVRLERYGCDDKAGAVRFRRRFGMALAQSIAACAGVVVDCAPRPDM